jgi:hypothetical protein
MFYFSYFFLKICVSSSLGRCYFRILFHVLIVNFISLAGVNLFLVLQQYGLILFCFDIFPPITVICSRSVFFSSFSPLGCGFVPHGTKIIVPTSRGFVLFGLHICSSCR